jgi:phosphogluconate dehydratase
VQLPGSSFLHPDDPLRPLLTRRTVEALMSSTADSGDYRPLGQVICEESIVNAVVALLATGGSTNHTLHMIAIARAAGIELELADFDELSAAVPLLARIYPNGSADINDFQAAGGMAFLVRELRGGGLLNESVMNILGTGLDAWCAVPESDAEGKVNWTTTIEASTAPDVLTGVAAPFASHGGLRCLQGNLGQCVIKVSAVEEQHHSLTAPCRIFHSQEELKAAFEAGEMECDMVAVVRFQGPSANGMPELHKMTPFLGVLQDRGFKVALVTDGRMSGASGKVPAAIHMSPEAAKGGALALLHDGDVIELDVERGVLNAQVPMAQWQQRTPATAPVAENNLGRNLFAMFRDSVSDATSGASVFEARQAY